MGRVVTIIELSVKVENYATPHSLQKLCTQYCLKTIVDL